MRFEHFCSRGRHGTTRRARAMVGPQSEAVCGANPRRTRHPRCTGTWSQLSGKKDFRSDRDQTLPNIDIHPKGSETARFDLLSSLRAHSHADTRHPVPNRVTQRHALLSADALAVSAWRARALQTARRSRPRPERAERALEASVRGRPTRSWPAMRRCVAVVR